MGILAVLGFLLIAFIVFIIFITIAAIIGAVFAWRVIAPDARFFSLNIDRTGVRASTEHGEIIPGTVIYKKEKFHEEKTKRQLTLGDDGELIEIDDDSDDAMNIFSS